MPNKTLPALALVMVFASCGPLVPLTYVKGKTDHDLTQTIETPEATVYLQYLQKQYGYYIFDLEVVNHSQEPMSMAPQFISFYASSKSFMAPNDEDDVHLISGPNSALNMRRQFANSPAATENIYYKKMKEKRTGAVLFAIIGAGLILYDGVKDSDDNQKETWTKKEEKKSLGRDLLVSVALTATDIANEEAEQAVYESKYVPFELFPECTIPPGKQVRGKIFIPIEASYRYSRVVVPVLSTDYVFDFKRKGVKNSN